MIRTFNYWTIYAPAMLLIAILLACFSVTEKDDRVKERGSEMLWNVVMKIYVSITGFGLFVFLMKESILGAIEFWGRDVEGSLLFGVLSLAAAAFLWSYLTLNVFMVIRKHRLEHIDYACSHGCSKGDRERRQRAKRKNRNRSNPGNTQRKATEMGKIYVMNPTGPNAEQKRAIEYRVQEAFKHYKIEKVDSLGATYTDEKGEKRPITDYLPEGVYEYYIAINLKDENAEPEFLGSGTMKDAERNLKRYLEEKIEAQVCTSKKTKHKRAINQ